MLHSKLSPLQRELTPRKLGKGKKGTSGEGQEPGEKIYSFINKIRQHADKCSFKCTNPCCTEKEKIHETLIRDQIIIGTSIRSIRENALKREYELGALITQARKIEANKEAVRKLDADKEATALTAGLNEIQVYDSESDSDSQEESIYKIGKKGGKYSLHSQRKKQTISTARNNIQKAMFRLWRPKM